MQELTEILLETIGERLDRIEAHLWRVTARTRKQAPTIGRSKEKAVAGLESSRLPTERPTESQKPGILTENANC